MCHVILFLMLCFSWFLLVRFWLPRNWYIYRIVKCGDKFYCEKQLKYIGLFWHSMWVDEYLSDEFSSLEDADMQLKAYLAKPKVSIVKQING